MTACCAPNHRIVPCLCCGDPVHTCERETPIDGNYCCPMHPNGIELLTGEWACSEDCYHAAVIAEEVVASDNEGYPWEELSREDVLHLCKVIWKIRSRKG